ncbi:MAG: flagellar basal body rod C-terminal domain-containing protein [Myxococcota bacterium]
MSIGAIGTIAASGASLAARRLQAGAHNVANLTTDGFEAQRVVARQAPGGGVTSSVAPAAAPVPLVLGDDGLVAASNTDLVGETVNRVGALAAYRANLSVLDASDEMTGAALDIIA